MRLGLLVSVLVGAFACSSGPADDSSAVEDVQAPESRRADAEPPDAEADPRRLPSEPEKRPDSDVALGTSGANATAVALEDFHERVDDYIKIHKRAARDAPRLKETNDPAKIDAAQDGIAANIREARANAQPGDIFTPDIRATFRRLLAPELKGEDGRDAKRVLKDDAPAPASIPFKVNAKYPDGAPLPTVPASILTNLPKLPEELEYRLIGKHLILLDTKADIIVDYIPNAIA